MLTYPYLSAWPAVAALKPVRLKRFHQLTNFYTNHNGTDHNGTDTTEPTTTAPTTAPTDEPTTTP